MIDREKVIKGLECCQPLEDAAPYNCKECPYNEVSLYTEGCQKKLHQDALEYEKLNNSWFSIKDRLPEPYMNVLCCVRKGWKWMLRVCWLNGNTWEIFDGYPGDSRWVDCDDERIRNDGWSVTHWKMLPEPPKEGEVG